MSENQPSTEWQPAHWAEAATNEHGYEWILDCDLRLQPDGDGVLVTEDPCVQTDAAPRRARLTYSPADGLRIDGAWVDVGDDLPCFLGVIDAARDGETYLSAATDFHQGHAG